MLNGYKGLENCPRTCRHILAVLWECIHWNSFLWIELACKMHSSCLRAIVTNFSATKNDFSLWSQIVMVFWMGRRCPAELRTSTSQWRRQCEHSSPAGPLAGIHTRLSSEKVLSFERPTLIQDSLPADNATFICTCATNVSSSAILFHWMKSIPNYTYIYCLQYPPGSGISESG